MPEKPCCCWGMDRESPVIQRTPRMRDQDKVFHINPTSTMRKTSRKCAQQAQNKDYTIIFLHNKHI